MTQATHKCPIDGCSAMLHSHLLMCLHHWRKVPESVKVQIYAEWNRGKPKPGYWEVRKAAIRSVTGDDRNA